MFDMVPKAFAPFGSQHVYVKPEREYHPQAWLGANVIKNKENSVALFYK